MVMETSPGGIPFPTSMIVGGENFKKMTQHGAKEADHVCLHLPHHY